MPIGPPVQPPGHPDDCLPKYPPPPVVKLKLRVPACSEPGATIKYCICIENCSTAEAHHVVVKNVLPANAKFVKADPAPSKQGPELQWNLGTVGGGASREIQLWLEPTNKEDVKNCARVVFEHGQCVVTRQAACPPVPDRPPFIVPVPPDKDKVKPEDAPILDLSVRGPKEQYANLASKYEITITNKGRTRATNTQVSARVSEKLKIISASEPGVTLENVVAWNLKDLEPGATRIVQLTLKALEKGEHCFKVIAEADGGIKKEIEHCTKFVGTSSISVEMVDRDDPVFVGHKTSYPILVKSVGGEASTGIEVRAFIPAELKLERANAAYDELPAVKEGKPGQWIKFKTLPKIEASSQARYEVFVEAMREGVTYFHIEVVADQLEPGRPVVEQESTTVVDDREKLKIVP